MTNKEFEAMHWPLTLFLLLLIFVVVLVLAGCDGHHYYSSTDRKYNGPEWHEEWMPGRGMWMCTDTTDGKTCRPE